MDFVYRQRVEYSMSWKINPNKACTVNKYLLPVEDFVLSEELESNIKKQFSESKYTFLGNFYT